jgi:hypothetical protein
MGFHDQATRSVAGIHLDTILVTRQIAGFRAWPAVRSVDELSGCAYHDSVDDWLGFALGTNSSSRICCDLVLIVVVVVFSDRIDRRAH